MYVDDVLLFCKSNFSNIKVIITFFDDYTAVSGQFFNCSKFFIFGGAMSISRLNILLEMSVFKIGSAHFVYLGVSIFKGKPKAVFFCPIADKVINKLASWKCSLLRFFGRVELVKSVI